MAVSAVFDLALPEPGQYDIKLWWAGSADSICSTWAETMTATIITATTSPTVLDGDEGVTTTTVLATRTFNLREAGGDEWLLFAKGVQLHGDHESRSGEAFIRFTGISQSRLACTHVCCVLLMNSLPQ